jgi:hypothetical protein
VKFPDSKRRKDISNSEKDKMGTIPPSLPPSLPPSFLPSPLFLPLPPFFFLIPHKQTYITFYLWLYIPWNVNMGLLRGEIFQNDGTMRNKVVWMDQTEVAMALK